MAKTRADVIAMALRRLAIVSADTAVSADQGGFVGDTLDALFLELRSVHGLPTTWVLEATPDEGFLPLSYLLATEVAQHFEVPSEPRSRAMGRLRAYMHPSDLPLRGDTDEDGAISEAEENASNRAQFY